MSRRELFLHPVALVWRNKTLWPIALLGLAINLIFSLLSFNLAFVFAGLFMAFMTIAFTNGALITMVNAIADGEPASVLDGLRAGVLRLVPLLAVNVAIILPTWIVLLVLTGGAIDAIFSRWGRPDMLQATNMLDVASAVLSLLAVVVGVNAIGAAIGVGAERAIVLEDQSIVPALQRGWQLVRTRFADYFMIAAVLFGLGLAVSLLFAVAIGPVLLSVFVPAGLQASGGAEAITAFYVGPGNVIYILINLVIMSLVTAYTSSVWTLAFRGWKREEEQRDE